MAEIITVTISRKTRFSH